MFKGILTFISYALSSIALVTRDTLCLLNALQIISLRSLQNTNYTATAYRQMTDKLMLKSVISTVK